MCGIVGYLGNQEAKSVLIDGLERLEYRGYDSAGIAIFDNKTHKIVLEKEVGKISALKEGVINLKIKGNLGIGHTRWATHGGVTKTNAHPHFDCKKKIFVVHNGIIENYKELKEKLLKRGHKFVSQTDTEVIAHLLEEFSDLALEDALKRVLKMVVGSYALVLFSKKEPGKIVGARKESPLLLAIGDQEYFLASDASAILPYTKKVIYLDDGDIVKITQDGFSIFDLGGRVQNKKISELGWDLAESQKGGYSHFMLKEIMEQKETLENTMRGRININDGSIKLDEFQSIRDRLAKIKKIRLVACGTAYHACLLGKYFFEDLSGIEAEAEIASEFRYRNPVFNKDTAILVVSQSGETADTLAVVKDAKNKGILTLGVVNVMGSTIAREVRATFYSNVGPEIGVASTKAFTGQVVDLFLIAMFFAGLNKKISKIQSKKLQKELINIPQKVKEVLNQKDIIKKTAKKYKNYNHFLYLGRRYSYPLALEGALKIKEISYLHAEGYPAGEMKHGPIAMIDENFPTFVLMTKSSVYDKTFSNIEEIKARKGRVVGVLTKGDRKGFKLLDDAIYIPNAIEFLNPILEASVVQLFAYFVGTLRGFDVDKPRNLAKSVTVE